MTSRRGRSSCAARSSSRLACYQSGRSSHRRWVGTLPSARPSSLVRPRAMPSSSTGAGWRFPAPPPSATSGSSAAASPSSVATARTFSRACTISGTPSPRTGWSPGIARAPTVQRPLPQLSTYLGRIGQPSRDSSLSHHVAGPPARGRPAVRGLCPPGGAVMTNKRLVATWVRRFLLEHVVGDLNLSRQHASQLSRHLVPAAAICGQAAPPGGRPVGGGAPLSRRGSTISGPSRGRTPLLDLDAEPAAGGDPRLRALHRCAQSRASGVVRLADRPFHSRRRPGGHCPISRSPR